MRRAARRRRTRQLEQVFEALKGDHTHPFAHEIYRRVHQRLPRISLATVYRNLHSLVEEGKIRTLLLDGQGARYDPETREYDHFVCERCGRVDDLFLRRARRRIDPISLAKRGYVVTTHNLMVHGMCQGCAARRRLSRPRVRGTQALTRASVWRQQ
ncbi:MAG: transcriptional repressor [Candidatus Rokuibacteriota bacterium]|nr:MAG: transcriptional repressor [Candidatus Rokubacteria bacterium]PYN93821.1 MAG: transcriptional repressor [Candidatus Rokubacteria bacterium]